MYLQKSTTRDPTNTINSAGRNSNTETVVGKIEKVEILQEEEEEKQLAEYVLLLQTSSSSSFQEHLQNAAWGGGEAVGGLRAPAPGFPHFLLILLLLHL